MNASTRCLAGLVLVLGLVADRTSAAEPDELARLIAAGLKSPKGLALDLGCGDTALAIAVARHSQLSIECIDSDPAVVADARRAIDAAGLYGTRLAARQADPGRLDLPDCCLSLVLCGDEFVRGKTGREFKEVYRLLRPGGVAWVGRSAAAPRGQALARQQLEDWLKKAGIAPDTIVEKHGTWARITRPRPEGWDEWTHRSHDPGNTFASLDTLSGPSFKAAWVSDYRPGLSSAAVAVAGDRVILASLSYDAYPETTPHIQVLDAFTGQELWARVGKQELPIDRPPGMYSNRENCSDIAVVGDDLYLLGGKFCHVFDLPTGKEKQRLAIPREVEPEVHDVWLYLACVGDTLFGACGQSPAVKVDWNTMFYRGVARRVFALERSTGQVRWFSRTPASVASLCLGGGRLYFCTPTLKLHAVDARSGSPLWSSELNYPAGTEMAGASYYQDKVWLLYNRPQKDRKGDLLLGGPLLTAGHNRRELDAYAADSGRYLFPADFGTTVAGVSFAGGLVFGTGQHGGEGLAIVDAQTGALKYRLKDSFKCTPSLASPNCFFSQRGAYPSILDLQSLRSSGSLASAVRTSFTGFRPSCSYPGVPGNGMLYLQAEGCACASPIRGNIALVPGTVAPFDNGERLRKGPAFAAPVADADAPAWATWRADRRHSGQSSENAAAPLTLAWTARLPGQLTPLAVGGGLVYCGSTDHKVYALDAASGARRWQHIAEGRVRVAPYWWRGRLYFSDDAGLAYCLRARQGDEVWRFRAALGQERMIGYGGFMSRWPARAGVVVDDDGTAYVAAGLFPDEGTAVHAVDALTGSLRWDKEFNTNRKGSRTGGFVPDGAMVLANGRLYVPSGSGIPWQVRLDDDEHTASFTPGYHIKGHHIMAVDQDLLGVTPGLQYVHHVIYKDAEADYYLPLVTEDTIYQLNRVVGKERYLVAGRRQAFQLAQNRVSVYVLRKDATLAEATRWKAWKDAPMTCIIRAGGILFSGGPGKVYATRAADGAELWSADLPGDVADLAFHAGRLFVLSSTGTIHCFEQK